MTYFEFPRWRGPLRQEVVYQDQRPVAVPPVSEFHPLSLFGVGDIGAIGDSLDPANLKQLNNGTVAVTIPGDPIGYVADLGPTGRPAMQATAALRPIWAGVPRTVGSELVTNGLMSTDTNWTKGVEWTIASGVASKVAGTASVLSQVITLVAGKAYQIHFVAARTAGTVLARFTGGTTVSGVSRNLPGSYTDVLFAVAGNTTLEFSADAAFVGSIDRVTIKEVATWTNMGVHFRTDRLLQTAAIDLSGKNKLTVVIACRFGAIVGPQVFCAQGNIATTAGCTDMQASSGLVFRLRGDAATAISTLTALEVISAPSPRQCVCTGYYDLAGVTIATEVIGRTRGITPVQTPSGTTAGAGNLANGVITFGRGAQGASYLYGDENRWVIISRILDATETVNTERWCRKGSVICAVLGDSTIARLSSATGHPNTSCVSSMIGGLICGAADVSNSGDRISQQKIAWTSIPDKSALEAVIIQIGLNDVKGRVGSGPETLTDVINSYQDLINTVRADVPAGCKIYASALNPCKVWLDLADVPSEAYDAWSGFNQVIAGTHPTLSITGVDGRITAHVAQLAGPGDILATEFDYNNDGVHEGNGGRFIVAQAWRAKLEADGLLAVA